jgi:hypothetical protein
MLGWLLLAVGGSESDASYSRNNVDTMIHLQYFRAAFAGAKYKPHPYC